MNENKIDTEVLQSIVAYYRNKCSQLEYEFLLFKTSVDKQIREIQSVANGGSNSKDASTSSAKERKPNGQGNKSN